MFEIHKNVGKVVGDGDTFYDFLGAYISPKCFTAWRLPNMEHDFACAGSSSENNDNARLTYVCILLLILQGMVGFWFNSHFTEIVSINCFSSKKNLVTHHSTKNYQLYIHPPILFLLLGFVSKNKKTKNQTTTKTKTKTKKLHLFALPGWTATLV